MSSATPCSFEKAAADLRAALRPLSRPVEEVPIFEAEGRMLAADIASRFDVPLFDNSAMDGFAVRTTDFKAAGDAVLTLPVCAVATAGHPYEGIVPEGAALRIMTGAPLPAGLDAVIPIEKTQACAETAAFAPGLLKPGTNVRRQGEIIRTGDVLLRKGTRLTAGALGLAASLGLAALPCRPMPTIGVFASGDELLEPADGAPLADGKIYNANGICVTLKARALGARADYLGILPDDEAVIEEKLRDAAKRYDIVVCSGGVGPGDCDFTAAVLNRIARLSHYHVKMRPGKPFSFGRFADQETLILGLPGNPVASATSAELFLRTAVFALLGVEDDRTLLTARLTRTVKSRAGRRDFVRGRLSQDKDGTLLFTPGSQQSSASLLSVAESNAVLIVPEDAETLPEGVSESVFLSC